MAKKTSKAPAAPPPPTRDQIIETQKTVGLEGAGTTLPAKIGPRTREAAVKYTGDESLKTATAAVVAKAVAEKKAATPAERPAVAGEAPAGTAGPAAAAPAGTAGTAGPAAAAPAGTAGTAGPAAAAPAAAPTAAPAAAAPAAAPAGVPADLNLRFKHVPTGKEVAFTAYLESFVDSFDAEWSSEKVFGRMDPIAQYKGTTRKITCSFTVPAKSHEHAYFIHLKISSLLRMMYGTWDGRSPLGVYNISAPPLMMVKFNNIIMDASDSNRGLLGWIPTLKYEPDMNSNIFTFDKMLTKENLVEGAKLAGITITEQQAMNIIKNNLQLSLVGWQSLKINFELNVLHTHKLGYTSGGGGGGKFSNLPYGIAILG